MKLQRKTKDVAQRPSDRGEAHGCADINAAQEVQALITEGRNAHSTLAGNGPVFGQAKKSNSPFRAKPPTRDRENSSAVPTASGGEASARLSPQSDESSHE